MSEPALSEARTITERLMAPFELTEVRFKPAVVQGNRALALAYIDARVIQDRLDSVLGVENWQDDYEFLADGSVVCRLRLKIGGEWITKVDVGGQSEQPDGGDRLKAAVSDSLKRAAVKFGVGRYLYRLPQQWADYDPQRRQFAKSPTLPAFAQPNSKPKTQVRPAAATPQDGAELLRRLDAYESKLAGNGLCQPGELRSHVQREGRKAGHPEDLLQWTGPAIQLAIEEVKAFEAQARLRQQAPAPSAQNSPPAAARPAAPAKAQPPRDDAEILDETDRRQLVQRLAALTPPRPWKAVAAWLSQVSDFPPSGGMEQLTYGKLRLIHEALAKATPKARAS